MTNVLVGGKKFATQILEYKAAGNAWSQRPNLVRNIDSVFPTWRFSYSDVANLALQLALKSKN